MTTDREERVSTTAGDSEDRHEREAREEDFWGHHVPSLDQCLAEYEAGPEPNTATMLDALGSVEGARVLDFACGGGVTSAWLADRGAIVTGIDLSPTSTARADELFRRLGRKATFVTGAAESMELPTPFDGIVGRYALHHIDCAAVAPVLAGLVTAGGRAAFLETMATNPLLNLARNRIIGRFGVVRLGTLDEHPLTTRDFAVLRDAFGDLRVELGQMRFLRIFDRQVLRYRHRRASAALGAVDDALYRLAPSLKGLSFHQVLVLTKT
jgi:2-polyprenyl-3-methyl-5-hydroxy-6-metoxy-1,4-benzoquinol methylase